MINDYFILALRNLRKQKLRSFLTLLGIFISVATIFTLISLSVGLQEAVKAQFEDLGGNKIFVQPKTGFLGPPGSVGGTILTEEDIRSIEKVRGVEAVDYFVFANAKLRFNNQDRYFLVIGLPLKEEKSISNLANSLNLEGESGRILRKDDKGVVSLGYLYGVGNLFGKNVQVRDRIEINGERFQVVGIMKTLGNGADDQNIYMPLEDFRELFGIENRVDQIMITVREGENVLEVAERVEKELRKKRGLTEKTQDFTILTPDDLLKSFENILGIITYFLAGVAAISLLVGAIGIANTMYTSVIERTKEIGVMKAIGAKNSDVLYIFLVEAGLLGLVGASMGVLVGIATGKFIEFIAINSFNTNLFQVATPVWLVVGCLVFGFLIGSISGAFPAWSASRTNTVDALRYE